MTNGSLGDHGGDVVQVVNAALSPADLAAALSGTADPRDGLRLARTLLDERQTRGGFGTVDEIRAVVERAGSVRFAQVSSALASQAPLLAPRVVGMVDPESTMTELGRVDGGTIRYERFDKDGVRPFGSMFDLSYEDFIVEVGLPGHAGFLSWVSESLAKGPIRRSGEVHVIDRNTRSLHAREFTAAVVTEVNFPACDHRANDAAGITITYQPKTIRQRVVDREPLKVNLSKSTWIKSNFWMSLEGTVPNYGLVTKVDAFSWAQTMAEDHSWSVDLPNVALTILANNSDVANAWLEWFELYAKGSTEEGSTGTISYLAGNLHEMARIEFEGLRPLSLQPQVPPEDSQTPFQMLVNMSCDQMHFVG